MAPRRATRSARTGLHRPVTGLRRPGRLAVQGGQRGGDRVGATGLAAAAAGLPVRPDHLGHLHALGGQVAGQAGPVASAAGATSDGGRPAPIRIGARIDPPPMPPTQPTMAATRTRTGGGIRADRAMLASRFGRVAASHAPIGRSTTATMRSALARPGGGSVVRRSPVWVASLASRSALALLVSRNLDRERRLVGCGQTQHGAGHRGRRADPRLKRPQPDGQV